MVVAVGIAGSGSAATRFARMAVSFLLLLSSCHMDSTRCSPGDYVSCACSGGALGYARCASDGAAYGTCDCSGAVPGLPPRDAAPPVEVEGGAGDSGPPDAPSLLPFMSGCEKNEQCESGLCFNFNAKGPHCSKRCARAEECPAPSTGCNNQGVCKPP